VTSPIIGTSKPEQLEDLVRGLDVKLRQEEADSVSNPYQPHPVLGHH
jgi:aryl-alcohol dehydrogenase-like predicted oxidoreductase